ncbi:transposable element Tc1 transposase [Trichonephila clavipes]|nr:transposable element Tc1 transposase [Trichonephila clavipes]
MKSVFESRFRVPVPSKNRVGKPIDVNYVHVQCPHVGMLNSRMQAFRDAPHKMNEIDAHNLRFFGTDPVTHGWCLARSGRNHVDCGRIVFSDESRIQLCPDDNRRRVWKRPGQRADLAFRITRPTDPQLGVIV